MSFDKLNKSATCCTKESHNQRQRSSWLLFRHISDLTGYFLIYLVTAALILPLTVSCSRGRSVDPTNRTVPLSREIRLFNEFNRLVQSQRRTIQRDIERARIIPLIEDVDRNRFGLIEANRKIIDIENFRGEKDIISSALSYDGNTILLKMEGRIRRGGRTINEVSLIVLSLQTGKYQEIYTYEKSEAPYYRDIFPSIAWDKFSNTYAFIGEDRDISEVFIGYYDEQNNTIRFNNFKITNNQEKYIHYYDVTWSPSGDKLAFTEYHERENHYSVRIFSLRDQRWESHSLGNDVACFRFCNQRDNGAFFVKKTSGLFYPFYSENYTRSSGNILTGAEGLAEPLFVGNFAFQENRFAYIAIENSDFQVKVHCFTNNLTYKVKSNYRDPQLPYIPNFGPAWVKDDNFVLVHNIIQRGSIFFSFANGDFLETIRDGSIALNRFIEERNLWDLSSITVSSNGKKILFVGYDNNIDQRKKNLYLVDIQTTKSPIPIDELMVPHRTNISLVRMTELGEPLLKLTRGRRVRGRDVNYIGYITARRDFYYYSETVSESSLISGGRNFIIGWPASLNEREIEVTLKEADIEHIVPFIVD